MPAIDSCEPSVIHALQKEGWEIVKQTLPVRLGKGFVYADLRARQSNQEVIVVEVKYFANTRTSTHDLFTAIGQYLIYRNGLLLMEQLDPIFLAIPLEAFERLFKLDSVQNTINEAKIKLLVVDLDSEEVVKWLG